MFEYIRNLVALIALSTMLLAAPGVTGCDEPLVSGVAFKVEPNVETLKVQLNFSKDVETDLGGTFDVTADGRFYGTLEVEPSGPNTPFNVGFRLNLGIVNEQEFVRLDPVRDLPSGQPIPIPGLNRALARLKLKNEINPNFDIYTYIDVADGGREWLGMAMTLKFINNKYFPAGLSISKGFVKDKAGFNQIYGAVFGPKVDSSGNMTVPGGIALFANARSLIAGARQGVLRGGDAGDNFIMIEGPLAERYRDNTNAQIALGQAFKELIKANSYGNTLY